MRRVRVRLLAASALAAAIVALAASPAAAHNEFEPATAAPGSVISLTLVVENERSDAGTTQVQLLFPEGTPLTLVELPAVPGWTTSTEGGNVGGSVTSVTWSRPTATPEENPSLPLRVGPLPTTPGRLQFKLLQTYSNGEIERWIDDWPADAPEPEMPPVVLDVAPGGPGDIPAATTTSTTAAPTTTTERASGQAANDDGSDDSNDSNTGTVVLVAVIVVGVAVIAAGVYWIARRRSAT